MTILAKGRYRAVQVAGPADLERALALRAEAFPVDRDGADRHDRRCRHVLVEDRASGAAVATFRLMVLPGGTALAHSYSAGFYDLAPLAGRAGPMVELGRFCTRPESRDADILRVAWAALARIVDLAGADMLFGCASFPGTDATAHADAFALLDDRHLAPESWRPRARAARSVPLGRVRAARADPLRAMAAMPPLLRSYLGLGGRVSDHAVIDQEMGTLHVFTGVEVGAIPPARRRALRAVAGRGAAA